MAEDKQDTGLPGGGTPSYGPRVLTTVRIDQLLIDVSDVLGKPNIWDQVYKGMRFFVSLQFMPERNEWVAQAGTEKMMFLSQRVVESLIAECSRRGLEISRVENGIRIPLVVHPLKVTNE